MLALLFIALFMISAPLLLLYATGYGLPSPRNGSWLPGPTRSAININSVPNGAFVVSDMHTGEVVAQGETPWIGLDFLPGDYQLTISAEGYIPFTQQFQLTSGRGWQPPLIYLIRDGVWDEGASATDDSSPVISVRPDAVSPLCYIINDTNNRFHRYCGAEKITGMRSNNSVGWVWSDNWITWFTLNNPSPRSIFIPRKINDVTLDERTQTLFVLTPDQMEIWRVIFPSALPIWKTEFSLPSAGAFDFALQKINDGYITITDGKKSWQRRVFD